MSDEAADDPDRDLIVARGFFSGPGYVRADAVDALLRVIEDLRRRMNEVQAATGQVYGIIDPDYGRVYTMVRKLAWEEGYAIGLHGSFTRDLDLVAVPWVEKPAAPEHLVQRIVSATGLETIPSNPGTKPQGRLVWTLLFPDFGDPRFVDLSVMPATQVVA